MTDDKKDLTETFMDTHHLMHRYHMIQHSKNVGDFDPRRGQGRILAALKKMHSINQRELAFILDIRQQSLGELLQKLELNGYIKRKQSEDDKRAMIVEITDKGRELKFYKPDYSNLFEVFNSREKETLKKYLQRLVDKLESLINEE